MLHRLVAAAREEAADALGDRAALSTNYVAVFGALPPGFRITQDWAACEFLAACIWTNR